MLDYVLLQPNLFVVYKVMLYLFLLMGAFYIERIAFWWVQSRPAAMLAGVVYLTAPYQIILLDHLAAFNESLALGIVPVLLWYVLQAYYQPTTKAFLQITLVWYVLATVHILTFLSTSFFIFFFLFMMTLFDLQRIKSFALIVGSYVAGCILAAWYLTPVVLMGKFFIVSQTFDSQMFYHAYETFLANLVSPTVNISGGYFVRDFVLNSISTIHPAIGLPMLVTVAILVCVGVFQNEIGKNKILLALSMTLGLAFILAWSPINFWQWLPQSFNVLQYSWRLLSQAVWMGALLSAWAMCWLFKDKFSAVEIIGVLALLIAVVYPWLPANELPFQPTADFLQRPYIVDGTEAYLLNIKKFPALMTVAQSDDILKVDQVKKSCQQVKAELVCHLISKSKARFIELPMLYYPAMLDIKVNGQVVKAQGVIDKNQLLVAIQVAQPGEQVIKARFTGTAWANHLSLLAWALWLIGFFWVSYRIFLTRLLQFRAHGSALE